MKANPKLMTEMAARNDWGGIAIELKKAAMLEFELTEEERKELSRLLELFINYEHSGIDHDDYDNEIRLYSIGRRFVTHTLTDEEALNMLKKIRKDLGNECKMIDAFLASTSVELP